MGRGGDLVAFWEEGSIVGEGGMLQGGKKWRRFELVALVV